MRINLSIRRSFLRSPAQAKEMQTHASRSGRYARSTQKCQLACKPGSVPAEGLTPAAAMAIHLGRASPRASSNQPGRRCGNAFSPEAQAAGLCRPYSVLLPAGFALPALSPEPRCALTAPFHPCSILGHLRSALLETPNAMAQIGRFAFCGTFPRVAPAGRYPAPCFRGARTFLHPESATTLRPTMRLSGSGHPANWRSE
jgi:hypothetical protein